MAGYILKASHNVDFFATSTPSLAYFLGFFWGDGYLYEDPKRGTRVSIEILSDDMKFLFTRFKDACNWNKISIRKKLSKNEFTRIYSGSKPFHQLLISIGFSDKTKNYDVILSNLDPKHHRYFYRGLLDSDGSVGRYNSHCVINISSKYNQDWSSLSRFCSNIGVEAKINKREAVSKKGRIHRFSQFIIGSHDPFFRFLDTLYEGADKDGLYLPRKYHRYLEIKRRVVLGIPGDVKNLEDFS